MVGSTWYDRNEEGPLHVTFNLGLTDCGTIIVYHELSLISGILGVSYKSSQYASINGQVRIYGGVK